VNVIGFWIIAAAVSQTPSPPEPGEAQELARLETVWNDAQLRSDAAALDKLWADDSVVVVPGMPPMTKADALGVLRSGRMKFQRYQTSELNIRVYENAAVVTGRLQRTREIAGRVAEDDWRFTKVYVGRPGNWKVVAYHASPFTP
jgi:ketosteroid isomerase-like protein